MYLNTSGVVKINLAGETLSNTDLALVQDWLPGIEKKWEKV